ncbi:DUF4291 domain-containing protein [Glycomyces algeriensis]|uniref:DUF4291 domain-containing protein n=1 Tax=Glycomyces algeriensis TaxID=256037 RepID=A0A9W6GDH9_9ACTN|nr:DUF4291 domain-containing protein [Glycomyces algeriensis]MDA1367875.1 DUF4291 domain-containing protein [Glycomyces algeriensis]MDR7352022.1 hypothetical protein [Glycomyces algeriensis]GLI44754.1 hypothetical protein GALLR39Z86_46040 [Glycomyces algeriensis]
MPTPSRQIRAVFDAETITVYQAYSPAIAEPALAAQTFVAPFKRERMTWIKPSFLWMMYRCGWAAKPGQERVLAVRITRGGFAWALAHSCGSYPAEGEDVEAWKARLAAAPVRVQWDPERGPALERLEHRSIQIGMSGEAVDRYTGQWITAIEDVTDLAVRIGAAVGRGEQVRHLLPVERPYPLEDDLAAAVGASQSRS